MARAYLDKNFLTNEYGLDLNDLPKQYSDAEINKYIYFAEIRITHISENFTTDVFNNMSADDQYDVRTLTAIIVEQWLKHGIPLTRVSTSANLSSVSSSATRPQDPAYVPHVVLEGLSSLGLLENFDTFAPEKRADKMSDLNDNELNSRIQLMIENAISGRFDGKENAIRPDGVASGDSKTYLATWINGVRQLVDLKDLMIAAGLSITPNKTIFGKKATTIDIKDFLKSADLDALKNSLEAADALINTEITSLKSALEPEVKRLQTEISSLSGKTSGGFIGNLTAASASSLSTAPASDKDYYYYHITSDPETVLGTAIAGQNGKWVKIEAKADLSGWTLGTTYLDASPFGLDAAGVDAKIAAAEVRIGAIIDTKIKPVVDWFEAQGKTIYDDLLDLANGVKDLETKDASLESDINATIVRIQKNEVFKKMFDDLTDGGVVFKTDDTNYKTMTTEQLAAELSDKTKYSDDKKTLAKIEDVEKHATPAKVKDSSNVVVELNTMTGQVSDTDTTEDTDKLLATLKLVNTERQNALGRIYDGSDITAAGAKAIVDKSGLSLATFLGDFPVETADTDAQIITKLDAAFTTAKKGDYVEIVQPSATPEEVNYFLMTKDDTTWNKGTVRAEHIKGAADGKDVIMYYKDQIVGFPIGKTPTPTSMWEDAGIPDGYTLIQGNTAGTTTGEIKAHTHEKAGYGVRDVERSNFNTSDTGGNHPSGNGNIIYMSGSAYPTYKTGTTSTGGTANKAAGYKVKFWKAKEDIKVSYHVKLEGTDVYASKDLLNVKTSVANAGKVLRVKADGTLEYYSASAAGGVAFYKGEIKIFNEVKTGTKFEDATLFTKQVVQDGYSLVGGTDGSTTNGTVGQLPIYRDMTVRVHDNGSWDANRGKTAYNLTSGSEGPNISTGASNGTTINTYFRPSGPLVNNGNPNLAAGYKLLKVIYVAKKDITTAEMA